MNILNIFKTKKKAPARVRTASGRYARKIIVKEYGQVVGYIWAEPRPDGVKYV